MITDFLIRILYVVIKFLLQGLNVFDDFTLSQDFIDSFTLSVGYANAAIDLFPMGTLYACLAVIVVVEIGINGFKGIVFLIKKIPFIN